MLTREQARALHDAGLVWTPTRGDVFCVPDRDLEDMTFVLSDMVVELINVPGFGEVLAFNGTTEWALDSLEASAALWLPREDQLRELIGHRLVSLELIPGPPTGWAVTVARGAGDAGAGDGGAGDGGGETERFVDLTPAAAYARALLALL